jgi:uncharacterized protein (TIGR03790 family)
LPVCFFFPAAGFALQPDEVLLITNRTVPEGLELARYYQQQRQIPDGNLLQVTMTDKENCSREEYQQKLVEPLRKYLATRPGIRCLLLLYGLPLRVSSPELTHAEWGIIEGLKYKKKQIDWQIRNRPDEKALDQQRAEARRLQEEIDKIRRPERGAAVDSELTLLRNDDYPLEKWLLNPYFVGFRKRKDSLPFTMDQVMMVARLDASRPEVVKRMIDDSLRAERHGLSGRAYFDARWPLPDNQDLQGYALYDASLHKAASQTEKLPVLLDQQESLLQPGSAPEAALYSGWYSLAKYVDAFDWQPGAVAYHIASGECKTLKKKGSQVWCKRLLEDGAAATIGPVAEPYVNAFPVPEIFFSFLLDGYYTLAESYFLSTPFLSWQMILVGDPLYRPFRNSLQ